MVVSNLVHMCKGRKTLLYYDPPFLIITAKRKECCILKSFT